MRILFVLKEIEDINLGVMYMSSMLKKNGHRVELAKAEYDVVAQKLSEKKPTILAFSTLAFYCDFYLKLNKKIKDKYKVFSIFGGPHPTGKPEIINEEGVDAVCIGEGEYPLLELADRMEKGENIDTIKNLWIKKPGGIIKNSLRKLESNIDLFPFPDRDLFKKKGPFYFDRLNVITARGCAYNCPYCYNNTLARLYKGKENLYRRRSVDNVIDEINAARKKQSFHFILFHDDIFILLPEWLKEFSQKYPRQVGLPFSCYIRIDHVTEEIVSYLKRAGCRSVSFGMETGDNFIRNKIFKRNMKRNKIIEAAKMLKKSGIFIRTTNMIGLPGGSLRSDLETLKLNIECKVDYAHVTMLSSYPNTDISGYEAPADIGWAEYKEKELPLLIKLLTCFSLSARGYYKRLAFSFCDPHYGFKNKSEKRKVANLHNLFAVVTGFPFLFHLLPVLLSFPRNRIFLYINFFWRHYCSYFRIYSAGNKSFFKSMMEYRKSSQSIQH